MSVNPVPLRMTAESVEAAADAWGFNCGPGAICAALGMTPDEVRPHLGDFIPWLRMPKVTGWWITHAWEVTTRNELDRRVTHACGDEARPASKRPWDDRGWTPS